MEKLRGHRVPANLTRSRGSILGSNCMTPEHIATFTRTLRERAVMIEISEGRGLNNDPLYGVTFRWLGGPHAELWRDEAGTEGDPSTCFLTLHAALVHASKAE